MTIYEKTYWLKLKLIGVLALVVIVSLFADQWLLLMVADYLNGFIPFFKSIERISDSITNKLSVGFLVLNAIGIIVSSLYFKNQRWSTFFLSWIIVFIGAALITNYLKISFGRIRPEEVINQGLSGVSIWFAKGDSFPSGHTSYYFSLFFAWYYFFGRLTLVLVTPILIALGRVIQKAHFVSDVLMSVWIVVTLTILTELFISWIIREVRKIRSQHTLAKQMPITISKACQSPTDAQN